MSNRPHREKTVRRRVAWLVACLLLTVAGCLLAGAAVKYSPFLFGGREGSDVYRRYCGRDGIEARFVKQLHVCDTFNVDVTVLHAVNDSAWWALWDEFSLPQLPEPLLTNYANDTNQLFVGLGKADAPEKRLDTIGETPAVVVTFSISTHTVCIFHTKTVEELAAVRVNRLQNEKIF